MKAPDIKPGVWYAVGKTHSYHNNGHFRAALVVDERRTVRRAGSSIKFHNPVTKATETLAATEWLAEDNRGLYDHPRWVIVGDTGIVSTCDSRQLLDTLDAATAHRAVILAEREDMVRSRNAAVAARVADESRLDARLAAHGIARSIRDRDVINALLDLLDKHNDKETT